MVAHIFGHKCQTDSITKYRGFEGESIYAKVVQKKFSLGQGHSASTICPYTQFVFPPTQNVTTDLNLLQFALDGLTLVGPVAFGLASKFELGNTKSQDILDE